MENLGFSPVTVSAVHIIVVLVVGFIATRAVRYGFRRIFNLRGDIETEGQQVTVTFMRHVSSVLQVIIWIIVALSVAGEAQVLGESFVTLVATFSVIIGYVVRDFIMDFIMGVVVLLEQQFRVGDTVTLTAINQLKGQVVEIGVRTTRLKLTETNETYIVSNRLLTSVIVHQRKIPKNTKGAAGQHAKK